MNNTSFNEVTSLCNMCAWYNNKFYNGVTTTGTTTTMYSYNVRGLNDPDGEKYDAKDMTEDEIATKRKEWTVRGITGFGNIGNTCYMNSVLQCMSLVVSFVSYMRDMTFMRRLTRNILFLKLKYKPQEKEVDDIFLEKVDELSIEKLATILSHHVKILLKNGENYEDPQLTSNCDKAVKIIEQWTIDPFSEKDYISFLSMFIEEIKKTVTYRLCEIIIERWKSNRTIEPVTFKKIIGEMCETFKGSTQNDCQELLCFILEKFHEETKASVRITFTNINPSVVTLMELVKDANECMESENISEQDKDAAVKKLKEFKMAHTKDVAIYEACNYWKSRVSKSHSFVTNFFTGLFHSYIVCSECGTYSNSFEEFNSFSISLDDKKDNMSLQDCMAQFVAKEKLEGDNQYNCSICKKKVDAIKRICIWEPPETLIVVLKRFDIDFKTNTNGIPVKLKQAITFPITDLDIRDYTTDLRQIDDTLYDLHGVCVHKGSYGFGHYLAYGINPINNEWYEFNDSQTSHIEREKFDEEVVKSDAYMLVYCRKFSN